MTAPPWCCQHPAGDERDHPALEPEGAAHWGPRMCGVACVRMVLLHRLGSAPSLVAMLAAGRASGAYRPGVGWIHQGLADLLTAGEVPAEAVPIEVGGLRPLVAAGGLAICSVADGFPGDGRRSGHLVLVHDHPRADRFGLRDPGRGRRDVASVDARRFDASYSGRAIVVPAASSDGAR